MYVLYGVHTHLLHSEFPLCQFKSTTSTSCHFPAYPDGQLGSDIDVKQYPKLTTGWQQQQQQQQQQQIDTSAMQCIPVQAQGWKPCETLGIWI
ncbi:hypothetical protein I7I48_10667 [Histoplasma ohiense]|nr:hypothetical protein I7I48_10667 [Histoplasma ohiense (nom. inval.)]